MRPFTFLLTLIAALVAVGDATGQMNQDSLFLGSNSFGESADTYIAASACEVYTPTALVDLGLFGMHYLLIANGTDNSGVVRLSQNLDEVTVEDGNSTSCHADKLIWGTSVYRSFDLSKISGDLELSSIELGIEFCIENIDGTGPGMDGWVPMQICFYYDTALTAITHDGINGPSGFDATLCSQVAADGSADLTVMTIPISETVPAGTQNLIVEIFTPGFDTDPSTDYCLNLCNLRGDVNLDGVLSLLDVLPFVDVLAAGTYQAEADANCDGQVNGLDVEPFIILLGGGE